jgi:hypothetical protein
MTVTAEQIEAARQRLVEQTGGDEPQTGDLLARAALSLAGTVETLARAYPTDKIKHLKQTDTPGFTDIPEQHNISKPYETNDFDVEGQKNDGMGAPEDEGRASEKDARGRVKLGDTAGVGREGMKDPADAPQPSKKKKVLKAEAGDEAGAGVAKAAVPEDDDEDDQAEGVPEVEEGAEGPDEAAEDDEEDEEAEDAHADSRRAAKDLADEDTDEGDEDVELPTYKSEAATPVTIEDLMEELAKGEDAEEFAQVLEGSKALEHLTKATTHGMALLSAQVAKALEALSGRVAALEGQIEEVVKSQVVLMGAAEGLVKSTAQLAGDAEALAKAPAGEPPTGVFHDAPRLKEAQRLRKAGEVTEDGEVLVPAPRLTKSFLSRTMKKAESEGLLSAGDRQHLLVLMDGRGPEAVYDLLEEPVKALIKSA